MFICLHQQENDLICKISFSNVNTFDYFFYQDAFEESNDIPSKYSLKSVLTTDQILHYYWRLSVSFICKQFCKQLIYVL